MKKYNYKEPQNISAPPTSNRINPTKEASIVSSIYTIIGIVWIILTDNILSMIFANDSGLLNILQTSKGMLYVAITGGLIFFLIYKRIKILKNAVLSLEDHYDELLMINDKLSITQEELKNQNRYLVESQIALSDSQLRYQLAVEGSNDGIWEWDINKDMYLFSLREKFNNDECEKSNSSIEVWENMIHPEDKEFAKGFLGEFIEGNEVFYQDTYRLLIGDKYCWILTKGKLHRDKEGSPIRMAGSHTDITEQINTQRELHQLAYYDNLTGLPNRIMIQENFHEFLYPYDKKVYILYIDIDNFKHVNDTLGHSAGDKLLVKLSKKFLDLIELPNIVARLSGDEFLIILKEIENIQSFLSKLNDTIEEPSMIDNQEFYITSSIGITIYPNDGKDLDTLLKNADTAMFYAKAQGKSGYCYYETSMEIETLNYTYLIKELRSATKFKKFSLYYQPIVDLITGELIGVEALIRWYHEEKGAIPPSDFIPIAEEVGYIKEITKWVFSMISEQKRIWKKKFGRDIMISMNISGVDLLHEDMFLYMKESFQIYGKFIGLQLEITETAIINNLIRAIEVITELKKMGVTIALDDFGTGYSSLTYLKKLPIDILKVDREFIKNIPQEESEKRIMINVIKLAHDIDLKVIAEGIETMEQVQFLQVQGCDAGQGYWLSTPVDVDTITNYIKKNKKFLKNN